MNKFLLTLLLLTSTNVMAEWSLVKGVSVGRAEMDIVDFKTFSGFVTKSVSSVKFTTLNLSLTAAQKKLYVTINTELPFSDKSYNFSEVGSNTVRTVEREDLGVTLGYNVYKGLNLFGGVSYGSNHYININSADPGTVSDVKETDVGPFLGATYSRDLHRYGNVSATLAYALLDGEITSNDSNNIFTSNSGDTTGFSVNVTYSNKYDKDSDYFLALKIKNYEYDDISSGSTSVDITKEKNFILISAGLTIY